MTLFGEGVNIFLTPEAIYRQLTSGPGVRMLQELQQLTMHEQLVEADRADQIRALASMIKSGWEGDASLNAFGAALPIYQDAMENSAKLDNAQDLLSRQIDSFTHAANSVRPVPPEPAGSPLDELVPFDVDYENVVTSYQSDAEHNLAIYRGYDGASSYNETNMPQEFVASGRGDSDVVVAGPRDSIPVGEPEPGPGGGGPSSGGYPGGGGPGHPGSGGYPGGSGPGPDRGDAGGDLEDGASSGSSGVTTPNEWRPSTDGTGLPVGQSSGGPSSGGGGGAVPVGGVSGGFIGGGPGGAPGGGPRAGWPGAGGGSVAGGPGAGGTGGPGPRPGVGVGAGALAAAEAAAAQRAAQAAGGRAGVGPMGAPVGGGRAKDEDVEHERRYLVETDAEGTFGSDVLTAPQVIGDEEYED